jgi:putative endonuclease
MKNMTSGKTIGKLGEEAAKQYLEDMGYKIIEINYRDSLGEIDLIGFDNNVLAFIEVKTRRSTRYGTPREAVDEIKQRKLTRVARSYLARNRILYKQIRFDVVEVIAQSSEVRQIRLIKDAFEAVT